MIKNIVFDIGNVILEGNATTSLNYYDIDKENKNLIENVVFNNIMWRGLDYGEYNFNEYFEIIKKDLPNNLKELARKILINSCEVRKINDDIVNLMEILKNNNYKIYILSDNNIDTYNYLKTTKIGNLVDKFCVSYMYHETKANKKLYNIFFSKFNLDPNECYFIDDKEENIKNSEKLGMKGFVFKPIEKNNINNLIRDMKKNGVNLDL